MKHLMMSFALLIIVTACASKKKEEKVIITLPTTLQEAVGNSLRSSDNIGRDKYRHPLDTLEFFGLRADMTVVEIWPSGGWYTEILAPYLSANGKYIIADTPTDPNGYTKKRTEWMTRNPEIAARVSTTKFLPPDVTDIAPEDSADMVLTFRNIHNWQGDKAQKAAFKSFFKALKPGGILGVVEHRAGKKVDTKSGYVSENEVIRYAEAAGFKLEGKSEINANPKDTKNYPEGVWTLPPRLKLGEKDKEKYLEIGESDRMTLKFKKPIK